ncbi:MAG: tRNA pseudouridine(55) synthase TruB, partial [Treponema sp.]|nr:tRNA pseudouridine(55) synthase TruB [Treponema sp.]
MKKNKNSDSGLSGIVLLAKQAGLTSFSSLSSVKRALSTTKVGHTGTLDSFADGLLVVLVGKLTHLVPHITNFDKTYIALVEFGTETDTLDPTGQVIKTGKIPTKEEIESVLPKFLGEIDQVPPAYSALHVDGKRASDLMREGKTVELKPRKITISSIKLLDFSDNFARIEVSCSKGTYIRSLARDIASACGTVAHLKELRRTRVGPFKLEDAVGADCSPKNPADDERLYSQIRSKLLDMDMNVAHLCGMDTVVLAPRYITDFNNGRPLKAKMFVHDFMSDNKNNEIAVFYDDGKFGGVITKKPNGNKFLLNYGFVIHHEEPKMKIFSWEQIVGGKFPEEFKKSGTAITIGSFDGSHLGHRAIFESVISQKEKNLVPGVITFTRSLRGYKNPKTYEGDVVSLSQKLENLT